MAQKRKADARGSSLASQAVRSAALPIRDCLVAGTLFDTGKGTLILARGDTSVPSWSAAFLLDTFCRGVKDVMLRSMSETNSILTSTGSTI